MTWFALGVVAVLGLGGRTSLARRRRDRELGIDESQMAVPRPGVRDLGQAPSTVHHKLGRR